MGEDLYLGLFNTIEHMDSLNTIMFNRKTNMSIPYINIVSNETNHTQVNKDLGEFK